MKWAAGLAGRTKAMVEFKVARSCRPPPKPTRVAGGWNEDINKMYVHMLYRMVWLGLAQKRGAHSTLRRCGLCALAAFCGTSTTTQYALIRLIWSTEGYQYNEIRRIEI